MGPPSRGRPQGRITPPNGHISRRQDPLAPAASRRRPTRPRQTGTRPERMRYANASSGQGATGQLRRARPWGTLRRIASRREPSAAPVTRIARASCGYPSDGCVGREQANRASRRTLQVARVAEGVLVTEPPAGMRAAAMRREPSAAPPLSRLAQTQRERETEPRALGRLLAETKQRGSA